MARYPQSVRSANTPLISYLNNAIKAKELFKLDRDYVVIDGEVLIVDEHTGRTLIGRRYNEGLHQAIEAKERVQIRDEYQTLATITLQNYFRMYEKLAGMTGTALTEASEFQKIYGLGVVPIPTNMPMIRGDQRDLIIAPKRPSSKPSWRMWPSGMRRASRCSSAPHRSPNPKSCPVC